MKDLESAHAIAIMKLHACAAQKVDDGIMREGKDTWTVPADEQLSGVWSVPCRGPSPGSLGKLRRQFQVQS